MRCPALLVKPTHARLHLPLSQTEEFEYMFSENGYQPPTQDYFNTDEKVRFYTGLPSTEILLTVFDHVSASITWRNQTLSKFQEFVMVLMKLRLNIPFQELAYRFQVSLPTVSRIFSSWLTVMDSCLSPLIHWPDRAQLCETMPATIWENSDCGHRLL